MKKVSLLLSVLFFLFGMNVHAQQHVESPDGLLKVSVDLTAEGAITYTVDYDGRNVLPASPLGLVGDFTDFSKNLQLVEAKTDKVSDSYTMNRIKKSKVNYNANRLVCKYTNAKDYEMTLEMQVSDNNIAFRYFVPRKDARGGIRVMKEATGFTFPKEAKSFLCPQALPESGWERTKPSYEEEYVLDAPIDSKSLFGAGFTFPCLFRSNDVWVLIGETGVTGRYCGSRLLDPENVNGNVLYQLGFPQAGENNGSGSAEPTFMLPGYTPWRTITVGSTLKPVVETTVTWDVVKELVKPTTNYKFGKGTWSWILWQDNSINYDDQVQYVDLASAMGFKYCLVDNYWDTNIGKEGIGKLARYARSKGVDLFLWYNSNGPQSDAPQGPRGRMDNIVDRKDEMRWMRDNGIKGIKVDFFGGDKQETMRLYEEILSDANDFGLMVVFHGCTIPRGWERMYPNYVGSEAVLASENLYFTEDHCIKEAVETCTHPFIRNAEAVMEFGGCFMNRYMSRDNKSRHTRKTTDVFEICTEVLFQNPIQNIALAPNNLEDAPQVCMDFLRQVPTTWDETLYIDGYPGRYVALARRSADKWYIAAVNAEKTPRKFDIDLTQIPGLDVNNLTIITGGNTPTQQPLKQKKGRVVLTVDCNDGVVIF